MEHRGQKRLNELEEERQKVIEAQRVQLVALLSAEQVCTPPRGVLPPPADSVSCCSGLQPAGRIARLRRRSFSPSPRTLA